MTDVRALACPNCGAPIRRGDLDCEYCGSALYAGRASEVTLPALAEAQQVIAEMQRRIKRNAYDGDAYYQLGLACFTLKLFEQAENAFEQAKRFSPGSALAHYFAGLAMFKRSEGEILSIQEFRIRQIRTEFERAAELDPNLNEAAGYLDLVKGLLARNHEDYAGALEPLNSAVAALPKLGAGWKVLAACHFQVGDYRAAIRAARNAFNLDGRDADLAYLIGSAHARLDESDEVEAWARRIAQLRGEPQPWQDVSRELRGQIG